MTGLDRAQDWRQDPRHPQFDANALGRLQRTLDYWKQQHAFQVVPLPWMAPESAMAHTRPLFGPGPGLEPATDVGALVASAEQAFMWLQAQGLLAHEAQGYIGWTPCFRNEQHYDAYHHHYFLKAELFETAGDAPHQQLRRMVDRVKAAWQQLARQEGGPRHHREEVSTGTDSLDLYVQGVELGSYGVRPRLAHEGHYLYGTALAEPRWSTVWSNFRP
jgi:hypothetical protein